MATQSELFKVNISQVLRTIWLNRGISRVEIAKSLQMDKSTVTKIVSFLLELGIVNTLLESESKTTGGRKPVPLVVNIEFGSVLGIEIRTDSYVAVIIDLNGEVVFKKSEKIDFKDNTLADIFIHLLSLLKSNMEQFEVLGVVLGLSGIINSRDGIVVKSNPLNVYEELNFTESIKDKVSIPVIIENDANCCCWGELISLKANRPDNMLLILGEFREVEKKHTYYSGIAFGFGIVIGGKVYYGHEFSAGEFKSLYSPAPSVSQFSLNDKDVEDIQFKPEELMKLLRELCQNISLIVNFFNMNEIVIGGAIEQYYDMIKMMLSQEIQRNWSYPGQMKFNIRTSLQSENTVAYGAASMFLERLFGIPEMNVTEGQNIICGVDLINQIKI